MQISWPSGYRFPHPRILGSCSYFKRVLSVANDSTTQVNGELVSEKMPTTSNTVAGSMAPHLPPPNEIPFPGPSQPVVLPSQCIEGGQLTEEQLKQTFLELETAMTELDLESKRSERMSQSSVPATTVPPGVPTGQLTLKDMSAAVWIPRLPKKRPLAEDQNGVMRPVAQPHPPVPSTKPNAPEPCNDEVVALPPQDGELKLVLFLSMVFVHYISPWTLYRVWFNESMYVYLCCSPRVHLYIGSKFRPMPFTGEIYGGRGAVGWWRRRLMEIFRNETGRGNAGIVWVARLNYAIKGCKHVNEVAHPWGSLGHVYTQLIKSYMVIWKAILQILIQIYVVLVINQDFVQWSSSSSDNTIESQGAWKLVPLATFWRRTFRRLAIPRMDVETQAVFLYIQGIEDMFNPKILPKILCPHYFQFHMALKGLAIELHIYIYNVCVSAWWIS